MKKIYFVAMMLLVCTEGENKFTMVRYYLGQDTNCN